jgi:hypothetical protein
MMGALGMFSRAQVANLKMFGAWIGAIGALALAALLFLTGRGATAISALLMLGPLVWSWMGPSGPSIGRRPTAGTTRPGPMTRTEAYEILGLKPGASKADIRAAHVRLMQGVHPDHGGSDWLASRINQARDVLLS